jgi:hypothetical protein
MNEPVPPLKAFKVGYAVVDLEWLLNAPYEDIGEAAAKIPPAIGYLGFHRSLAMERLIVSEQNWKKVEAKMYFDLKNGQFTARGLGDKASEEALKRAIMTCPEVDAACADYAKRKQTVEWLSSSIDALQAKLELVRSSEATRRMEHEPDKNKNTVI